MRAARLRRVLTTLKRPSVIRSVNGWFTIAWLVAAVPTVMWLRNSVLWVAILSLWANVVSHYTAWLAARVEVRAQAIEGHVETHSTKLDAATLSYDYYNPLGKDGGKVTDDPGTASQ